MNTLTVIFLLSLAILGSQISATNIEENNEEAADVGFKNLPKIEEDEEGKEEDIVKDFFNDNNEKDEELDQEEDQSNAKPEEEDSPEPKQEEKEGPAAPKQEEEGSTAPTQEEEEGSTEAKPEEEAKQDEEKESADLKPKQEEVPIDLENEPIEEEAKQEDEEKESADLEPKQEEVPIDLENEPIELNDDQFTDISSEGFSEADEESDKANSKISFQALVKSQALKCTCYCKPGGYRSCNEIKIKNPRSRSGYYKLHIGGGRERRVYCYMGRLCGRYGGWMRLVDFHMGRRGARCPRQLQQYITSGRRHCGRRRGSRAGCTSVNIPTQGVKYSQVCGRVTGYQYGHTDGAHAYSYRSKNINGPYIDGVSITRRTPRGQRQHVWTYVSALSETRRSDCPCFSPANSHSNLPRFVGRNYYCESGFPAAWSQRFAINDLLWDGRNCRGRERNCCRSRLMPSFFRSLGPATAGMLELRVCTDERALRENVSVRQARFYVR